MRGNGFAWLRSAVATAEHRKATALTRNAQRSKARTEGGLMAQLSRLAKGLRRAYAMSGAPTVADFATAAGVSYSWLIENMRKEDEPLWLRTLRAVKRATGLTWDEILGR